MSKFHSLGLGNAYEPLLLDYIDFVITARSAAPIPADLLVLYTILYIPEPLYLTSPSSLENSSLLRRWLQAH